MNCAFFCLNAITFYTLDIFLLEYGSLSFHVFNRSNIKHIFERFLLSGFKFIVLLKRINENFAVRLG